MTGIQELLVGVAIVVGIVGGAVQILPGAVIIGAAILLWAIMTGGAAAWAVCVVALLVLAVTTVIKYVVAARHLAKAQVPNSTIAVGVVLGVVGFFVIPVVGLFVGFIGGVFLVEFARRGAATQAWDATRAALKATGLTILIELFGALVATTAWIIGVIIT